MEKAIAKLKFEIGVLKGLNSNNNELKERIESYEKAVQVLENFEKLNKIHHKKQKVRYFVGDEVRFAKFPNDWTDEEIVEHFEDMFGCTIKWSRVAKR